jgi:tRNA pseudouridine55 synthase
VIELRRTGFAHFDITQAKTFEDLEAHKGDSLSNIDSALLGADEMLPDLNSVYLNLEQSNDIKFGRKILFPGLDSDQKVKLYDEKKEFIGIGQSNNLSEVLPKRLFIN